MKDEGLREICSTQLHGRTSSFMPAKTFLANGGAVANSHFIYALAQLIEAQAGRS
jgi:hypothetical protein